MVKILLIIGSGSFIGGIARYILSHIVQNTMVSAFPFGTFTVNMMGCFLIGLFYGSFERMGGVHVEWRLFLTIGFCGSFTTFSTFTNENMALLKDGNLIYFALYTGLSVFIGLLLTYLGILLTKLI